MNFGSYPDSSSLFSSCFDLNINIDTDIYLTFLEEEDEEDEKRTEQIRKRLQLQLQLQLQLRSRIEDKSHQYMNDDSNLYTMTPTTTFWYIYYILNGNEMDIRAKVKFWR